MALFAMRQVRQRMNIAHNRTRKVLVASSLAAIALCAWSLRSALPTFKSASRPSSDDQHQSITKNSGVTKLSQPLLVTGACCLQSDCVLGPADYHTRRRSRGTMVIRTEACSLHNSVMAFMSSKHLLISQLWLTAEQFLDSKND